MNIFIFSGAKPRKNSKCVEKHVKYEKKKKKKQKKKQKKKKKKTNLFPNLNFTYLQTL